MKMVDVIVKKLLTDFITDTEKINTSDNIYKDLNLSLDDMDIIRQRLQLVFSVIIPQDIFLSQDTYGELCSFVHSVYQQNESIEMFRKNILNL